MTYRYEPTGHCPLNCGRTARPVMWYFFVHFKFLPSFPFFFSFFSGGGGWVFVVLGYVFTGWEMVTCEL